MRNKICKITCPYCKAEYFPAEIYIYKNFFNPPSFVEKDAQGKILSYSRGELDVTEEYTCDFCGNTFNVKSFVSFETSPKEYGDLNDTFFQPTGLKIRLKESE